MFPVGDKQENSKQQIVQGIGAGKECDAFFQREQDRLIDGSQRKGKQGQHRRNLGL